MRSLVMPRKRKRLDGRCVFCLEDMSDYPAKDKTDEHVIPDALRGDYVIEDGACSDCAQKSNKEYENIALNNDLLVPRRLLDLKSSKKRGKNAKQPKPLPPVALGNATMDPNAEFSIHLEVDQYPQSFALIYFPPPGLLAGVDRGSDLKMIAMHHYNLSNRGAMNVTQQIRMSNGPFAMMIAKIGYCFAAAELGIEGFYGDQIRDLLAGRRDDLYNFVGGCSTPEKLTDRHLHGLYLRRRGDYWTALVHLFASCDADKSKPSAPYEVVVGRFR